MRHHWCPDKHTKEKFVMAYVFFFEMPPNRCISFFLNGSKSLKCPISHLQNMGKWGISRFSNMKMGIFREKIIWMILKREKNRKWISLISGHFNTSVLLIILNFYYLPCCPFTIFEPTSDEFGEIGHVNFFRDPYKFRIT